VSPRTVGPAQVVAETALTGLTVPLRQSGVLLGRDRAGVPVVAPLFGPRPVTVVFIGGWWAAQVLVHRCLGHGATVLVDAVDTNAPAQNHTMAGLAHWLALDRTVAAPPASGARSGPASPGIGRVRPMAGEASLAWPATATQPLLRVHDVGPAGPGGRPLMHAWQTQLTALARLTAESLQLLGAADLVLVQRLEALEAGLVGSALLLGPDVVARITALDNETVVALRGPSVRYAWLTPTALERQAFG